MGLRARATTVALAVCCAAAPGAAHAAAPDLLRAVNAVPPGESGFTSLPDFAAVTAGASSSYGPHTDDQRELYANWRYKPMQFAGEGEGAPAPGDANVRIWRDPVYGVPTITGATDADAFYGVGYAMAQDRLFQMEAFRHVGHGTLAELVGPSGLDMDEAVRRFSEGAAARMAEFEALPADARERLRRCVDGINAYIAQVAGDPSLLPAEYVLLNALPIRPWTIDDLLGFGEYAGRFFGEFGHGEMGAAATYRRLLERFGTRKAERVFDDLLPLDVKRAPTSIEARDGVFKRHTGRRVRTAFRGSRYANHDPALLPTPAQATRVARAVARSQERVHALQRLLAIPRFGSNAVLVNGRRSATGRPMLYGGPQTGWAVPGFFWEVEIHSPARDQRGVMVPAVPVMVIGRSQDTAWTVTSALDANEDVFAEQLDPANATYRHDGRLLTVKTRKETLRCGTPPTAALPLLSGGAPELCPAHDRTFTVYRTVHGPALADPDASHRLYTRQSVVDGNLLRSFDAWDQAGRTHSAGDFGRAISRLALGFNFFYADAHGSIAYWHAGAYPIRPANADPRIPMPGDGRYDWQGMERWRAHPHVVNPSSGYLVNWNNKPSVGWWSKNLEVGGEGGLWGEEWESVPLAAAVRARSPLDLDDLGQVPRDVAYVDNRARVLLPALRRALRGVSAQTDPQLAALRAPVDVWNGRRDVLDGKGAYGTPAVVFFDRFAEKLVRDVEEPALGDEWPGYFGMECATCHLRSVDNLSTPTYKFEYAGGQLLVAALRGHTRSRWIPGGRDAVILRAARDAAAELTAEQGADATAWNEPVETGEWSAQGALSAPPLSPLQNRGSYAQVVEAGAAR